MTLAENTPTHKLSNQPLKPGDVVMLKSGGPRMTVESFGENEDGTKLCNCTWFDNSMYPDIHSRGFSINSLMPYVVLTQKQVDERRKHINNENT